MSQFPYDPRLPQGTPPPPPPPPAGRAGIGGIWVAVIVVSIVFVLLLGVTVALLVNRGGDDDRAGLVADGGATGSTSTPAESGSGGVSTESPSEGSATTPAEGDVVVPAEDQVTQFASPSGNISCVLVRGGDGASSFAECGIGGVSWTVEQPADCELDWGGGQDGDGRVTVDLADAGQVVCAGDALPDPAGAQQVPYGQAIWLEGEIVCRSAETGMRCESLESGHGFVVSRANLDLY